MTDLANKICLVTGSTRGIGFAIARMLLEQGAQVIISGRQENSVENAVSQLKALGHDKVRGKAADLRTSVGTTSAEAVDGGVGGLFRFIDTEFGGLDVLVNNAGVGVFRSVEELTIEDWRSTLETNLYAAFYASREAVARFRVRGSGYIVNISSLAGANAFAGGAAYNASKFGLNGFSEAMMQDLRAHGIRVSYVMPGSVATEFGGAHSAGAPGPAAGMDWKIWPEDVAHVVRMLLTMPERTLISRVELRPSQPKR